MGEKDTGRGKVNQRWMGMLGLLGMLFFTQACSSIAYVQINDRLPAKAGALEGKKVFLTVEDERKTKDFAAGGVKREFDNFSESLAYSVSKGAGPGLKMGLYDVPSLVKEAFRLRVENEGAEIVVDKKAAHAELAFALREFSLDLVGRNWIVKMGYEVRLIKDGAVLAKQFATGEAERFKIMGTDQADVVVGDLFADVMNRLNLPKLFLDAAQ